MPTNDDARDDVIRCLEVSLTNAHERYESLASKYHALVREVEDLHSQKSARDLNVRREQFKVELKEKAVSAGLMWLMSRLQKE